MTAASQAEPIADCEAFDGGFLAQDVNAWSSLAYVVAGIVIASFVARRRLPPPFLAFAAVVAMEGVGSLLFHGRGGDLAQQLHDGPMLGLLGFIAGWHAGRLVLRANLGALIGLMLGLLAGAIGAATSAAVTNAFVAVGVAAVVVTELLARRRGQPAVVTPAMIAVAGFAGLVWVFGTSQSPLCDAESWAQPHALFHIVSALLVLAWCDRLAAATPGADRSRA